MKRFCVCAIIIIACVALVPASLEAATKSERLYEQYEKLNTLDNLGKRFVGGKLLPFQEEQIRLLTEIGKRPTAKAAPVVVRIADEYHARIRALGAVRFRRSPLQALQISLITLMNRHAGSNAVFQRLEVLIKSPLIKEYARGRALGTVAGKRLAEIRRRDDPDGKRRGRIVLDVIIGDITMKRLLHAPARLREACKQADAISAGNPLFVRKALAPAADTLARRYAVDYVFVAALFRKQAKEKKALSEEEKKISLEICREWLKEYRPVVEAEKYSTDVLGKALLLLGGCEGNDDFAALLIENGLKPQKYVEPPPRRSSRPR